MSDDHADLEGILSELEAAARETEALSAGRMLEVIGARGFGPVLVLLSVFLLLPVGMIPGLPAVVAVVMAMIGGAMVLGWRRLTLPGRIARLEIASSRVLAVTGRVIPHAAKVRKVLRPRLRFLAASRPAIVLIGLALIATGLVLFFVGFVPFLPFVLALHVLLLGLGLTMRDGLAILAAVALVLPEVALILRLI